MPSSTIPTLVSDASGVRDDLAIILVRPQLGENIGQAARAMANFGLSDLRLVAPRDGWPNEAAVRAAAAAAEGVITGARLFLTVEEAVADLHFVCATSARGRQMTKATLSPEAGAGELLARRTMGRNCGVLFGPERCGLENEAVALADVIITAPVSTEAPSLNLAQTVLLICYEWRKQTVANPQLPGRPASAHVSLPAKRAQLLQFFEHLEGELNESGFLKPPEKRAVMVANIRSMFERLELSEQEVKTLRGIVASLCRANRPRPKAP
jgi:tRNA/rRNA methyltransferase